MDGESEILQIRSDIDSEEDYSSDIGVKRRKSKISNTQSKSQSTKSSKKRQQKAQIKSCAVS